MKNLIVTICILFCFVSCDNPVSKKIKETKENVSNSTKAVKEINNMREDIETLKNITPLTNEELKEWLPDEILGMKRTGFKAGQMGYLKIASIEATYTSEDKNKKFNVQIIDGAGEMGASATAGMRILFSQEFEEEDEYKARRTTSKNGLKVIEEYRKDGSRSSAEFMQEERFYIKAIGTNMDLEETWDAIDELEVDDLD